MDTEQSSENISVRRLRIGVVMLLLWWIPIWLLSPILSGAFKAFGINIDITTPTINIALIQTVIGAWIAGKQINTKKAPKTMWRVLISGKTDN